jgi:tellurite resistance protein
MDTLPAAEALVLTVVLVAAADGGITDREIGIMSGQVKLLPAFQNFTPRGLADATDAAVRLLKQEDGLTHAANLIRSALTPKLRETAYALACEIVAGGQGDRERSLDMLEFVRTELRIDPIIAAAIERGVRALFQPIEVMH